MGNMLYSFSLFEIQMPKKACVLFSIYINVGCWQARTRSFNPIPMPLIWSSLNLIPVFVEISQALGAACEYEGLKQVEGPCRRDEKQR